MIATNEGKVNGTNNDDKKSSKRDVQCYVLQKISSSMLCILIRVLDLAAFSTSIWVIFHSCTEKCQTFAKLRLIFHSCTEKCQTFAKLRLINSDSVKMKNIWSITNDDLRISTID